MTVYSYCTVQYSFCACARSVRVGLLRHSGGQPVRGAGGAQVDQRECAQLEAVRRGVAGRGRREAGHVDRRPPGRRLRAHPQGAQARQRGRPHGARRRRARPLRRPRRRHGRHVRCANRLCELVDSIRFDSRHRIGIPLHYITFTTWILRFEYAG